MLTMRFTIQAALAVLVLASPHRPGHVRASSPAPEPPTDEPCTVTSPNTKLLYDLRPLIKNSGEDWKVKDLQSSATFYLNMCREILYDKTGLRDPFGIGVYQEMGVNNGRIVGRLDRKPFFRGDKLMIRFSNGDDCPGGGTYKRSTVVSFTCDKTVPNDNPPRFITEESNCFYMFEWRTPYACPTSGTGSAGLGSGTLYVLEVIFKVLLILLAVYFALAILFRRFMLNTQGWDQIPHANVFREIGYRMRDMAEKVMGKARASSNGWSGFVGHSASSGRYSNLPGDYGEDGTAGAFMEDDDEESDG